MNLASEMINKVLQAERDAVNNDKKAIEKSAEIISEAKAKAEALIAESKQDDIQKSNELIENAKEKAAEIKEFERAKALKSASDLKKNTLAETQNAQRAVIEAIIP